MHIQTLRNLALVCLLSCGLQLAPLAAQGGSVGGTNVQDVIFVVPHAALDYTIPTSSILDGHPSASVVTISNPSFGSLVNQLPVDVTYVPGSNFPSHGLDFFTYQAIEGSEDLVGQVFLVPEVQGNLLLADDFDNGLSSEWKAISDAERLEFVADSTNPSDLALLISLGPGGDFFVAGPADGEGDGHSSTRVRVDIEADGVDLVAPIGVAWGRDVLGGLVWQLELQEVGVNRQIRGVTWVGGIKTTPWIELPAGESQVTLDWWAAEASGAQDGGLMLRIEDKLVADLSNLANYGALVTDVFIGSSGSDPNDQGSFTLDNPRIYDDVRPVYRPLFADGVESSDFSEWDQVVGTELLKVTANAALSGQYGIKILAKPFLTQDYLQEDFETPRSHYRARFQLDPHNLQVPQGGSLLVLRGPGAGTEPGPFEISLVNEGGALALRTLIRIAGRQEGSFDTALPAGTGPGGSGPLDVRLQWWSATDDTTFDGGLRLSVEGASSASFQGLGLDNPDFRLSGIQLGNMGATAGTQGSIFVDAFESLD